MADTIVYVDPGVAGGLGDGTTWINAYASIKLASLAMISEDVGGNDVIFLCRTLDGTKDTGGGGFIQAIVNAGTVYYRGNEVLTQTTLDTTKYIQNYSDSNDGIDIRQANPIVEYIQFEPIGVDARTALNFANTLSVVPIARNCLIDFRGCSRAGQAGIATSSENDNGLIYNNFIYDTTGLGVLLNASDNAGFYNNTIVVTLATDGIAILSSSLTPTLKNNLIQDASAQDYDIDAVSVTSAKNISSDTTSPDEAYREITKDGIHDKIQGIVI